MVDVGAGVDAPAATIEFAAGAAARLVVGTGRASGRRLAGLGGDAGAGAAQADKSTVGQSRADGVGGAGTAAAHPGVTSGVHAGVRQHGWGCNAQAVGTELARAAVAAAAAAKADQIETWQYDRAGRSQRAHGEPDCTAQERSQFAPHALMIPSWLANCLWLALVTRPNDRAARRWRQRRRPV